MDRRQLDQILEWNGFKLVRNGKHAVYSNGRANVSVSRSPSDHRSYLNTIRDIKRVLRLTDTPFIDQEPKKPLKEEEPMDSRFANKMQIPPIPPATPKSPPQTFPENVSAHSQALAANVGAGARKKLDGKAKEICINALAQGLSQSWMAEALNGLGYGGPEGSPLAQPQISRFLHQEGLLPFRTEAPADTAPMTLKIPAPVEPQPTRVFIPGTVETTEAAPKTSAGSTAKGTPSRKKSSTTAGWLHEIEEIVTSNLSEGMKERFILAIVKERLEAQ